MSEIGNYLRLMVNCDKEFKISQVTGTPIPTLFTSRLTSGYTRRSFAIYNNSNSASGESYLGDSTNTNQNGMPIPKGSLIDIPLSNTLPVYLSCDSGQLSDLRVFEGA